MHRQVDGMESSANRRWIIPYTLHYFGFICGSLYLLQTLIFPQLILGHRAITPKKNPPLLPLRFSSHGAFKILQVADMHFGNGAMTRCRNVLPSEFDSCSDLNTTRFLGGLIDAESPDFVAFRDSGDRATAAGGLQTYGWNKESQLRWLHGVSLGFLPSPIRPPAVAFFHIPVPEVRQLWSKEIVGGFQQDVSCSMVNSGVFQRLLSMGDEKAVFVGHDHTNDFCGKLDGVWLRYGGGCGYHGYGKAGWARRARVIAAELGKGEKAWMGVERIKTWKRLDEEKLSIIDEQVVTICIETCS